MLYIDNKINKVFDNRETNTANKTTDSTVRAVHVHTVQCRVHVLHYKSHNTEEKTNEINSAKNMSFLFKIATRTHVPCDLAVDKPMYYVQCAVLVTEGERERWNGAAHDAHRRFAASKFSRIIVSRTTPNTTLMLVVSVAVVKCG